MTDSPTSTDAINAALAQNWKKAIKINSALIKTDTDNIDTLNRLAFAYLKEGNDLQAKKCYSKVLRLDPYNQIAQKNLEKLSTVKKTLRTQSANHLVSPLMFLEEPGKTKIVQCVHTAPTQILSTLAYGQIVYLRAKKHCIEVRTEKDVYLGALPDDISFKLIKYLEGKNEYVTTIKSVGKNSLTVFIRELSRGKRFKNQPSFISHTHYLPPQRTASSDSDVPDVTPTGEEGDTQAEVNS